MVGRKYSGTEVSHRHSFDAHVRLIPTTLLTIHSHTIYKSNKCIDAQFARMMLKLLIDRARPRCQPRRKMNDGLPGSRSIVGPRRSSS